MSRRGFPTLPPTRASVMLKAVHKRPDIARRSQDATAAHALIKGRARPFIFTFSFRTLIIEGKLITKVLRNSCPSRERRSTFAAGTALNVLGMPRHCTGFILGMSVTHPWPASPCSALIPEMLVGSDGTSQRLRTRRSLQEARDPHVFEQEIHSVRPTIRAGQVCDLGAFSTLEVPSHVKRALSPPITTGSPPPRVSSAGVPSAESNAPSWQDFSAPDGPCYPSRCGRCSCVHACRTAAHVELLLDRTLMPALPK